jgi:regulatory protein
MKKKEIPGRMIEEVIGDLRRSGLVDDGLFARTYLRDQLLLRPGGKLLLRRKLRSVGIGPAVAEEAINEVLSDGEHRAATDAARKFLSRRPRAVDPAGTRKRLAAFLARRGFEWETIRTVLRESGLPAEENG